MAEQEQITVPRKGIYLPLPLAIIGGLLLVGILAGIGALIYYGHHSPRLLRIDQADINSNSTLARTLGSPLSSTTDDKTMHLLVYYDGYKNESTAQHYVGLIQATLRETEPFKSANNLTVTAFTSPTSECHLQKSVKTTLKCDATLLNQVNNLHYKHFKLLILSPQNFVPSATVARGKNSALYLPTYQGSLTQTELDTFVSLYFLHELGHSFGLRDEYARTRYGSDANQQSNNEGSGSSAYTAAQPNCAPDQATAQKWWSAYAQDNSTGAGYYPGCAGNPNYFYPVQHTVMNPDGTNNATYGRVSEDYLRGVLQCFYGGSKAITYPKDVSAVPGTPTDCKTFTAQYPDFWQE